RDAEELALHLALSIGDHTTELLFKSFNDFSRIGTFGGKHGGHRGCGRGRREQFQSECLDGSARHFRDDFGIVNQRIATGRDIASCSGCDVIECSPQSGDESDRRRVSRLACGSRLPLLAQVEVVTRILAGLHALPRSLAHRAIGETRRNHDRLLRSPNDYVNAPAIHVEVCGAKSRNGIYDKERVGVFGERSDALNAVTRTGGGLRRLHEDSLHISLEPGADFFDRERLAVRSAERIHLTAESFTQAGPALAKFAGAEYENAIAGRGE